jgi:COMPASS component SWD3
MRSISLIFSVFIVITKINGLDTKRPIKVRTYSGAPASVETLASSSDSETIAAGGSKGELSVWRLQQSPTPVSISFHRSGISTLSISPDGKSMVSGDRASQVAVWSLSPQVPLRLCTLTIPGNFVKASDFSQDGSLFAVSGYTTGEIQVFEVKNCKQLAKKSRDDGVDVIHFSMFGSEFITGGGLSEGEVHIHNSVDKPPRLRFGSSGDGPKALGESKNLVALGSRNSPLTIWSRQTGKILKTLETDSGNLTQEVQAIAISSDEEIIAASFDFSCRLGIWNLKTGLYIEPSAGQEICNSSVRFNSNRHIRFIKSHLGKVVIEDYSL